MLNQVVSKLLTRPGQSFAAPREQRRAPSQRPELSDARRRPLWPRRNGPGGPSPHPPGRLCRPSASGGRARATPSRAQCPRRSGRSIGRATLCQTRWPQPRPPSPRATHSRSSMRPPPRIDNRPGTFGHQRVRVATVNAESGCLKVVDTARIAPVCRAVPALLARQTLSRGDVVEALGRTLDYGRRNLEGA